MHTKLICKNSKTGSICLSESG